jgi:hypothetical protein
MVDRDVMTVVDRAKNEGFGIKLRRCLRGPVRAADDVDRSIGTARAMSMTA